MSNSTSRREQLRRQQEQEAARRRTNRIIGFGAGIVAAILAVVLGVVVFQSYTTTEAAATIVPPNASAKKDAIVVKMGKANAPTVTLYADFQCPNCKNFEATYGSMLRQEADAGTWTLQYKTMVFMDKNLQNTASTRAAIAAGCADVAGVYADYVQAVYDNQPATEIVGSEAYSPALLRDQIPVKVGLTGAKLTTFQQCVDKNATKAFVAGVDKSAYTDGVTATPTLTVNGKKIDTSKLTTSDPAALKQLILAAS